MLDPSLPRYGKNKRQHYIEKFGEARFDQFRPQFEAVGKQEGINFNFGGMISNTLDSHRLLAMALGDEGQEGRDRQDKVVNLLFKAYFEEAKNIGDPEVLIELASAGGLDVDAVKKLLRSDAGVKEVLDEMSNRNRGVRGVPHFIINSKFRVGGAEDPQEFVDMFDQIAAE
eukprot:CFRG5226T1